MRGYPTQSSVVPCGEGGLSLRFYGLYHLFFNRLVASVHLLSRGTGSKAQRVASWSIHFLVKVQVVRHYVRLCHFRV